MQLGKKFSTFYGPEFGYSIRKARQLSHSRARFLPTSNNHIQGSNIRAISIIYREIIALNTQIHDLGQMPIIFLHR